ncbi:MAG TPA: hypothetical protein VMR80_06455 [Candidatus Acidoferrum sp.]|nr:hypothetical protein [Candidatus Acidoferrum sp.]
MYGRVCSRLLAISILILAQDVLHGQSDSARSDVALPLHIFKPPISEPHFPGLRVLPPGTFGFPQLARAAGIIFSGTVTGITRRPPNGGQTVETVAITFRVESAIRGSTRGDSLTVSQWIGMWSSGQRYRIGERVLLFLYPPGKLGLTSCVGGAMGRFTVDSGGRVLLSAQHLSAFRRDSVLGGKSRASLSDFAWAVRRATEGESVP